jgi:hypothetical protein
METRKVGVGISVAYEGLLSPTLTPASVLFYLNCSLSYIISFPAAAIIKIPYICPDHPSPSVFITFSLHNDFSNKIDVITEATLSPLSNIRLKQQDI